MTIAIRNYRVEDKQVCLAIFDSSVPDYFDISEREELEHFLDEPIGPYFVLEQDGQVIGGGGFRTEDSRTGQVHLGHGAS